jgi:hypothetical protein
MFVVSFALPLVTNAFIIIWLPAIPLEPIGNTVFTLASFVVPPTVSALLIGLPILFLLLWVLSHYAVGIPHKSVFADTVFNKKQAPKSLFLYSNSIS